MNDNYQGITIKDIQKHVEANNAVNRAIGRNEVEVEVKIIHDTELHLDFGSFTYAILDTDGKPFYVGVKIYTYTPSHGRDEVMVDIHFFETVANELRFARAVCSILESQAKLNNNQGGQDES